MIPRTHKRLTLMVTLLAVSLAHPASDARAGVLYLNSCSAYGDGGNDTDSTGLVWQGYGNGAYGMVNRCPQGGSFQIVADYRPRASGTAQWETRPPSSIKIVHAFTPYNTVLIDPTIGRDGYSASFFWHGGSQRVTPTHHCCGGMDFGVGINRSLGPSRYFGFQVVCHGPPRPCNTSPGQLLDVRGISLEAVDDTAPTLLALDPNNLFYQGARWVRGIWPASFSASDDSGVCTMRATVDGQSIPGPTRSVLDQHSWRQCPSPTTMQLTVDTTRYANGPLPLTLSAGDAASPANVSSPSATLNVDNQPVSLTMSGASDASSTAGTQYVVGSAAAGPSGVSGISCSVDGSSYRWYRGASAEVPVSGLGEHVIDCYAQNNSVDSSGAPAISPIESHAISIRQPSVSAISFSRAITRPPHTARHETERIAHGARTTISGWLATYRGQGLGGQRVRIVTAPDNGRHRFAQVGIVATSASGSWSARLPAGPSRLVEARFDGNATVEPATSKPAHLVVPASLTMSVRPHYTHWGGTIAMGGDLRGGYVPRAGELVVLWVGWPGGSTEIGHVYARRGGWFHTTYTFLRGNGIETYRFWAETARESDYPYAPASSGSSAVTVGP